jgi:hypothetical protein
VEAIETTISHGFPTVHHSSKAVCPFCPWWFQVTNRRDYGTFSKSAPRLLNPMVENMGYQQLDSVAFGRPREGWIETFFLQQSVHGGGDFVVEVGLSVPDMDDLWQEEAASRSFGLIISKRLGSHGLDGGYELYPATNKIELVASLEQVANDLKSMDPWFATFESMVDIAAKYRKTARGPLAAINYGFLLILAKQTTEAKAILENAQRQWQKIVLEEDPYLARKRPGKESLAFHALDVRRLAVVEAALRTLA